MKRSLSYVLFVAGVFLVGAAFLYYWHTSQPVPARGSSVPDRIAGVGLLDVITGQEAIQSVNQLHGKDIPIVDGSVANYGNQNVVLWVSEASDEASAAELTRLMVVRIAEGRSPFVDDGIRQVAGYSVYALTGLGQRHFYWQSGSLVLWIAADEAMAEQALAETVEFYR